MCYLQEIQIKHKQIPRLKVKIPTNGAEKLDMHKQKRS